MRTTTKIEAAIQLPRKSAVYFGLPALVLVEQEKGSTIIPARKPRMHQVYR
jgi:hypothetical protein